MHLISLMDHSLPRGCFLLHPALTIPVFPVRTMITMQNQLQGSLHVGDIDTDEEMTIPYVHHLDLRVQRQAQPEERRVSFAIVQRAMFCP